MRLLLPLLLALVALPAAAQPDDDWDDDSWGDDDGWEEAAAPPVEIHGFAEGALSARVVANSHQPGDFLLDEARFRLDVARYADRADVQVKADALADALTGGVAWDVRQALVTLRPGGAVTLRAGRQVTTWGTGDLVFLNDLFPKDFVAFFTGRDVEFLKAPANALRATLYRGSAGLDLVWTPRFTPDRYVTGERLSFFSPAAGRRVGLDDLGGPLVVLRPDAEVENGEVAARLFGTFSGYEVAGYGYAGFTKQPVAFDPAAALPTFAPLSVVGASVRRPLLGGLSNAEIAYYDARADRAGDDPLAPNGQARWLVGHEREILSDVTLGLQYYAERALRYDRLLAASPTPAFEPSETRHVLTSRWTARARQQTLTLSLFTFWSPTDGDAHLRPSVQHQWSDQVALTLGGHLFFGPQHTLFGQFEDDTSVYARARFSF